MRRWVDVDPCLREPLLDGAQAFHLLLAAEYAALELEVVEAVLFVQGFGLLHQPLRGQHLLTAETEPGVRAVALVQILHLPAGTLFLSET